MLLDFDGMRKIIGPVYGNNTQLVVQITDNGTFRKLNLKAYADSG